MNNKLTENLVALPKMMSARVMALCGVLGYVWLQLTPEMQQTVISHSPLPMWSVPIVMTVLGLLSRIWPQTGIDAAAPANVPPAVEDFDSKWPPTVVSPKAAPPVLTDVVGFTDPPPVKADDHWKAAMKLMYPKVTDDQLERMQSVVELMRHRGTP